jgi:glucose/arabinose dehydrogenase
VVAWGIRNAFGLAFLEDGRLLALDHGPDDRGSRPIGNAPDLLWEVRRGAWYGWPDFVDAVPVTNKALTPTRGPAPAFLLAHHDRLPTPEQALVRFAPHTAATRLAVGPMGSRRWEGRLLVTLFGDELPLTGPAGPRVGRSVVEVDVDRWTVRAGVTSPLVRRPIDVAFSTVDRRPYVLDFGWFEMRPEGGVVARPGTGALWRLDEEEP